MEAGSISNFLEANLCIVIHGSFFQNVSCSEIQGKDSIMGDSRRSKILFCALNWGSSIHGKYMLLYCCKTLVAIMLLQYSCCKTVVRISLFLLQNHCCCKTGVAILLLRDCYCKTVVARLLQCCYYYSLVARLCCKTCCSAVIARLLLQDPCKTFILVVATILLLQDSCCKTVIPRLLLQDCYCKTCWKAVWLGLC